MTTHLIGRLVTGIAGAALAGAVSLPAIPIEIVPYAIQYVEPQTVDQLIGALQNSRVRRILKDLVPCESGGNPDAINPMDRDGTPSLGLVQFKPSTLYEEGRRYKIFADIEPNEIQNIIFDPSIQIAVVSRMIEERGTQRSFWLQQFPGCGLKYHFWDY